MTQSLKIFSSTVILSYLFIVTLGQRNETKDFRKHLTIPDINRICKSIDNNENLGEAICEGQALDGKDGFDIYYLHDSNDKTLYRVTDNYSTGKYVKNVFYFYHKELIKATITITHYDLRERDYVATYYFDNNSLLRKVGEISSYSNHRDIFKQGTDIQAQYYKDRLKQKQRATQH